MFMSCQWLKKCKKTHASREGKTSPLKASPPEEYLPEDPPLNSQHWESGEGKITADLTSFMFEKRQPDNHCILRMS